MNNLKDISLKTEEIKGLDNPSNIYMFNKIEKIVSAIYLVTDFLPDGEPLKFSLRERSIKLMSFTMSLTGNYRTLNDEAYFKIFSSISEIDSMLKIAFSAKLISEMNYQILSEECHKFLNIIEQKKGEGLGRDLVLPKSFFYQDQKLVEQNYKGQELSKGHLESLKDKQEASETFIKDISKSSTEGIKDIKKNNAEDSVENKDKKDRREKILKIIKDKREVSIKDIIDAVKDCSEKTIQRELISMTNEDIIKKEGERRWSRYSLR